MNTAAIATTKISMRINIVLFTHVPPPLQRLDEMQQRKNAQVR
jgi:hypothetical protein